MRYATWLLMLFFLTVPVLGQDPFLRVSVQPGKGVIVGQTVRVTVDVMVPNYFTGSPEFPQFELENAIVVLPEDRPEHINTKIGAASFAGIRRTYMIYPEQPGEFTLPPAVIRVSYAAHPPATAQAQLQLPPKTFQAVIPTEARDLDYFLATTQLRLTQKWSTQFQNLRVGDSFDRTITVTTQKMQAMFIPPVPLDAPDGIRIYSKDPETVDQKTPTGEFVEGRRIQHATYVIEKRGRYTLPEVEIQWWDLTAGKLRKGVLPAVSIIAVANPNYVAELPPDAAPAAAPTPAHTNWSKLRRWTYLGLCVAAILLALAWVTRRYGYGIFAKWQSYRTAQRESEPSRFKRLAQACRKNDAHEVYRFLLTWLAKARPGESLEDFAKGDRDLYIQVLNLTAVMYSSNSSTWSGHQLLSALGRCRRESSLNNSAADRLPALNP